MKDGVTRMSGIWKTLADRLQTSISIYSTAFEESYKPVANYSNIVFLICHFDSDEVLENKRFSTEQRVQ